MPAYNAAEYIGEAIESVLSQTFSAFELLIVNDGSTDDTVAVIESFSDERIVLVHQANNGVAAALNTGLRHARAPYIARIDADDTCYPDRLEKQYNFMLSNPGYIVIGSSAEYTDASGNYIFTYDPPATTDEQIKKLSYDACPFIHATVFYKKDAVIKTAYNIYAHSFEDHLLWQQIKEQGKMFNMPERFVRVRLNPGSLTMDERMRPKAFHVIKHNALKTGNISPAESGKLLTLIRKQNNSKEKEGAYYFLLAKKFLWNNYNPIKARQNIRKVISLQPGYTRSYFLWMLSFFPKRAIERIYHLSKQT